MAKILGLKQLLSKKFTYLENLPQPILDSFGKIAEAFIMIVWGMSGNGKSNFLMQLLKVLCTYGKVLYVSLEEGFEASMFTNVSRHLSEEAHSGKVEFADHEMSYDKLVDKLAKKKSPKFIIIDSLQYWNIDYTQYKALKERFPRKAFIFISHASGKLPDGKTADKIRYDAGIKVHVDKYVAFVKSRYGGNQPYVIWEDGARAAWGKKYAEAVKGIKPKMAPKKSVKTKRLKNEEVSAIGDEVSGGS